MERRVLILFFLVAAFSTNLYAGAPLWTFTPLTATTLTVSTNSSATVQYLVTNQSRKSHSLAIKQMPATQQMTAGVGICSNPFVLDYQQSCVLSLQITGSLLQQPIIGGPTVCQTDSEGAPNPNTCYQPTPVNQLNIISAPAPSTTTILANSSNLALSVNCPVPSLDCTASNAALTGTPRTIIITNVGGTTALNVTYTASFLPPGTTIIPNSCDMTSGNSCIFTITPGETPSAAPGDLNPTPISLSFSGTNTNTVSVNVNILTYGSVYQSGYVFAVDDTTANNTSIIGKVAALTDQATLTEWQPGCVDLVTCTATGANDYIDGSQNSMAIVTALSSSYPANAYAGGVCNALSIDGYADWYLPALCEMSYHDAGTNPCGSAASPTIQNIQSSLIDNGIGSFNPSVNYWSSTQDAVDPLVQAFFNYFGIAGYQAGDVKSNTFYVRCARQF